ncbi:MAG: DUF4293 family protein [Balneolaceae bacterium]
MIQRIQTIFLAIAALINLGVFFTPLYRHAVNDPNAWIGNGFAFFLTAAMIILIISIFLYKNRPKQLKWVKAGTYFQVAAVGFAIGILFSLGGIGVFLWAETLVVLFLIISLALYWQAGRFIQKDEELVQSMDRIR